MGQNTSKYCSRIIVGHVHANGQGWTQRVCLRGGGGGGALQAKDLNQVAQAVSGGEYERGWRGRLIGGGRGELPRKFFKIYVSENAFQANLKPSFPYSITSILSKVRHSKPRGGGGTLIFSYIHRLGIFFWGVGIQNLKFRYFGGFSEK